MNPQSPDLSDTLSVVDTALATLARRVPSHVSREDLASAGKLALVKALLRFQGPPSKTRAYCYVCVRGALLDELRRLDPLSRYTRTRIGYVRKATSVLQRRLGRAPAATEVAAVTGYSTDTLAALDRLAEAARNGTNGENGYHDGLNSIADGNATCPARAAEAGDTVTQVRAALNRLDRKQAFVLRRYYLDEATLEEIAQETSVSKERVRQIREAAEKRLREDFVVLALWQTFLTRPVAD